MLRRLVPLVVCVAALGAVAPPAAAKDPKKEAIKLIARGDQLFRKGDYEGALAHYQKAYEAFPNPKILYPIAKTEEQLGRDLEAIAHYEQLLAEAEDLSPELRDEAQSRIQEIEKRLVVVTFEVTPEGATISVDDVELGQAPLERPVRLRPGTHRYAFVAEGYKPLEMTVELEAGERPVETIQLVRERPLVTERPRKRPPPAPPPPPPPPKNPKRGMLILGIAVTAGLGVGATLTGLGAVSAHGTYADGSKPLGERLDARDRGQSLALATDLFVVGAALAGGFTVYYYYKVYKPAGRASVREPEASPATDVDDESPPEIGVTPWFGPGAGGVTVRGTF